MTEKEKYVMVRLCANLLVHTELYHRDTEVKLLIDWCIVSNQCKVNNNRIREIMKEMKGAGEGRRRELIMERGKLYEEQLELRGRLEKMEIRMKNTI